VSSDRVFPSKAPIGDPLSRERSKKSLAIPSRIGQIPDADLAVESWRGGEASIVASNLESSRGRPSYAKPNIPAQLISRADRSASFSMEYNRALSAGPKVTSRRMAPGVRLSRGRDLVANSTIGAGTHTHRWTDGCAYPSTL